MTPIYSKKRNKTPKNFWKRHEFFSFATILFSKVLNFAYFSKKNLIFRFVKTLFIIIIIKGEPNYEKRKIFENFGTIYLTYIYKNLPKIFKKNF